MNMLGNGHERRADRRSRCLKGARIILANGNSTLACRVRNLSGSGLRLAADATGIVPNSFTLLRDGTTTGHLCKVTWRSQDEIGAKIIATTELEREGYNPSNPLMRKHECKIVDRYPV